MRHLALVLVTALSATAATAQDWSGPYAGLGVARAEGAQDGPFGLDFFPLEGSPAMVFGGYAWQSGSVVYGGELAVHANDIELVPSPGVAYNRLVDLKGRVGYAAGQAMVYGVLGFSRVEYENGGFTDSVDGLSYGAGVDLLVSDRVFGGIEYLRRDLDHNNSDLVTDIRTISLRIGMTF